MKESYRSKKEVLAQKSGHNDLSLRLERLNARDLEEYQITIRIQKKKKLLLGTEEPILNGQNPSQLSTPVHLPVKSRSTLDVG